MERTAGIVTTLAFGIVQVIKAKEHILEKLTARVAGADDSELSRLLGEDEAAAKRRAAIAARLQVRMPQEP